MLVFLDPGHGGNDPGASSGDLVEKDLNLQIAREVDAALQRSYIVETSLTRTTDVTVSLDERVRQANDARADLFLSLHVNGGGGTGFESFIHPEAKERTQNLRRVIHSEIMAFLRPLGIIDRGMKSANFFVLRVTVMPAVLLESLFIDQPQDVARLSDPVFIGRHAQAIARGVGEALLLPAKCPGDQEKDTLIAKLQAEVTQLEGEVSRLRQVLEQIRNQCAGALK